MRVLRQDLKPDSAATKMARLSIHFTAANFWNITTMEPIEWLPGENGGDYYRRSQAIIAQRRKAEYDAQTERNRKAARQDRAADERQVLRFIFATLPTCDDCGSTDIKTNRTIESTPEAITRSVVCKNCGAHFRCVLTPENYE